ncbi:hypothetical protein ACFWP5_26560 [Streptomyces sp. NPDC058469]|uniref:hypothetical protein n=1 Tax=Streptomyces sp. NPDC058469 TaxID=3346514 RepID=UPI00364C5615
MTKGITTTTERMKERPATDRLYHRSNIQQVADALAGACDMANSLARNLDLGKARERGQSLVRALDSDRPQNLDYPYIRELTRSLARDISMALSLDLEADIRQENFSLQIDKPRALLLARKMTQNLELSLTSPDSLDRDRASDRLHARELNAALDRDQALRTADQRTTVRTFIRNLASVLDDALDRDINGTYGTEGDDNPFHEFTFALDLSIIRARAEELTNEIAIEIIYARARALDLARALDRSIGRDLIRARERAHTLLLAIEGDLAENRARDLESAIKELRNTANDFRNSDLRTAKLTGIDLSWLIWDERTTKWPKGWAQRIRNASVEQPIGSGQFVVLPSFGHNPAALPVDAP